MTVAHVAINVSDWDGAKQFYEELLGPLGYRVVYEEDGKLAYSRTRTAWTSESVGATVGGAHIAFACSDRETVERFHPNALALGGRDNGAPGIRAQYDTSYYAAYVLDPDAKSVIVNPCRVNASARNLSTEKGQFP